MLQFVRVRGTIPTSGRVSSFCYQYEDGYKFASIASTRTSTYDPITLVGRVGGRAGMTDRDRGHSKKGGSTEQEAVRQGCYDVRVKLFSPYSYEYRYVAHLPWWSAGRGTGTRAVPFLVCRLPCGCSYHTRARDVVRPLAASTSVLRRYDCLSSLLAVAASLFTRTQSEAPTHTFTDRISLSGIGIRHLPQSCPALSDIATSAAKGRVWSLYLRPFLRPVAEYLRVQD